MHKIFYKTLEAVWIILIILLALQPVTKHASAQNLSYKNNAVILMYHRFGEDRYPATNIQMDQFSAHIQELNQGEYNVLSVPEIILKLKKGEKLPDKTIGITIDDAFKSVYEKAFPILKEADFPFTLFLSTEPIGLGENQFMTWANIKEMKKTGLLTLGNHLVDHNSCINMSEGQIHNQINRSQATFRNMIGEAPELFSYPYGEYSPKCREIIKSVGFKAAFGQHSGSIYSGSDFFTLPRYALNENFANIDRFRLIANTIPLPVSEITPETNVLKPEINPPPYGFTVSKSVRNLQNLRCYASAGGKLRMERIGSHRFEIRLEKPFPKGRSRINCTTLSPDGQWHWHGIQFVVP